MLQEKVPTRRIARLVSTGVITDTSKHCSSALKNGYMLDKAVIVVGRDEHRCDIFIDSFRTPRMISRNQATFSFRDGQWVFRDSNSTNGSFLNDRKVNGEEDIILEEGDNIVFGRKDALEKLSFRFEYVAQSDDEGSPLGSNGEISCQNLQRITVTEDREEFREGIDKRHTPGQSLAVERWMHDMNQKDQLSPSLNLKDIISSKSKSATTSTMNTHPMTSPKICSAHPSPKSKPAGVGVVDLLEKEVTCSVCQSLLVWAVTLPCSHSFCSECIVHWLIQHYTCLSCRESVSVSQLVPSRALDNIVKLIKRRTLSEAELSDFNFRYFAWDLMKDSVDVGTSNALPRQSSNPDFGKSQGHGISWRRSDYNSGENAAGRAIPGTPSPPPLVVPPIPHSVNEKPASPVFVERDTGNKPRYQSGCFVKKVGNKPLLCDSCGWQIAESTSIVSNIAIAVQLETPNIFQWHHVECFAHLQNVKTHPNTMMGFSLLSEVDQQNVLSRFENSAPCWNI